MGKSRFCREIIETLRYGEAPAKGVPSLTVDRRLELKDAEDWLNGRKVGILKVLGKTGNGKTHLLLHTGWMARKMGWAVAYAPLNLVSANPAIPITVYRELIASFRDPNYRSFRQFLIFVVKHRKVRSLGSYPLLGSITRSIWEGRVTRTEWDWIEGKLQEGSADDMDVETFCTIVGGVAKILKEAGFKGLLLIIDNFEVMTTLPEAASSEEDIMRAESLVRELSRLATSTPYLKLAVGSHPENWYLPRWGFRGPLDVRIDALNAHSAIELVRRLRGIYEEAHGVRLFLDGRVTALAHKNRRTRDIVKACIEALDEARWRGNERK